MTADEYIIYQNDWSEILHITSVGILRFSWKLQIF